MRKYAPPGICAASAATRATTDSMTPLAMFSRGSPAPTSEMTSDSANTVHMLELSLIHI